MSGTVNVVDMPQPLGLYADDLFERGKQYLSAFECLMKNPNLPYPTYYSLSHTLELFLKAYLVAHGTDKKGIKDISIRHSVGKLLERCKEHNLPTVDHLSEMALRLEEMNSDYDFRYPTGYNLTLPDANECLLVITSFRAVIEPIIKNVAFRATVKFHNDTQHLKPQKIRWSD